MPSRMGNKLSSACIIHGEEEGLLRGLPRVTFVPLSCMLYMNAAKVSVLDRSCLAQLTTPAQRGKPPIG